MALKVTLAAFTCLQHFNWHRASCRSLSDS